ncbi:hypothetical protein RRG08_020213 [Elysia crispata]|uniref:Uncharacterized protein n=1 Tax=Elysia crispata TaxID=231223 RepID=A0AAE1A2U2_9GAST|nr:hypothetical protein RRG08_020213 [Elysia crispata]
MQYCHVRNKYSAASKLKLQQGPDECGLIISPLCWVTPPEEAISRTVSRTMMTSAGQSSIFDHCPAMLYSSRHDGL